MKKIWEKIINIGVKDGLALAEVSKIKLLNKIAFIASFASFTIDGFLFHFNEGHSILNLLTSILPAFILLFNHKGFYREARIWTCIFYPVAISYYAAQDGAAMGEFTIFLVLIILAFILFESDSKLRDLSVFWNTSNAIGLYLYIHNTFELNPIASNTVGSVMIFLASVIVLSYMIIFYQKEINLKKEQNDKYLKDLQDKNLELERFAFISSHDLKVPLKNIIGFSALTSNSIKDANFDSASDYLDIINTNARRMDHLIEDTLEIISYDKKHSKCKKVNLDKVFDQVIELIAGTIEERNVKIIKHKKLPKIKAIKSEMLSCFKNLIENAIKYNESENPSIEIDFSTSGDNHYLSFKDNGIGLKEDQYEAIFEMYHRLVRQDDYEGTGLGLPICKKIVEKIGGKIWVESEVGKGSTFYVELPKMEEEGLEGERAE